MNKAKNNTSVFDDNFEVTYEEEIPFSYTFETRPMPNKRTASADTVDYRPLHSKSAGRTAPRKARRASSGPAPQSYTDRYIPDQYDTDDGYGDYGSFSDDDYEYSYTEGSRPYDEDYDDYGYIPEGRDAYRARRTPKYGTKSIYRTARAVIRVVSLLITAGTLGLLLYNFWRGAAPYGDWEAILSEKNYTLGAYAAVASIFLLFELVAFFWSMTRTRVRDGRRMYKEDTGRGFFSFIFIYISSYLSFLVCSFLPERFESLDILNGIRGALAVFGSLHNVLLGLCLAGVISCLVRRHMI